MAKETISKLDAARKLCDAAATAFLDRRDVLATIVLAGSAADVLAGLMGRQSPQWPSARDQMVAGMQQFAALERPPISLTEGEGHTYLRSLFNWLRHADTLTDPQEWEGDFEEEASEVLDRALTNWFLLTGTSHPRFGELAQRH